MEQQQAPAGRASGRRTGQVVGAALLGLLVLGGFANGAGTGLLMLGLAALVAGGWTLVRGHASWVHLATRRAGLVVGVAGLAAFVVGAALSPTTPGTSTTSASGALARPSTAPTTQPAPAPLVVQAAPSSSAPVTTAASLPPAPVLALTCPTGGSNAAPTFGEQISATGPYTVDIDYGDGDHYRNDDEHLAAVFSHAYRVSGNFTVSALLTDSAGQTTSASCVYSWTEPAPAPVVPHTSSSSPRTAAGGGSSVPSGNSSPSGGDTYTNVDGNQVHVPVQAPSAPAGATAQCRDGSWSFSQHHSGTCSGHGGVSRWL